MGKSGGKKKKNSTGGGGAAPVPATTTWLAGEAASAAVPNGVQVNVALLLRRAHELKEEGNRLFQAKDYAGAMQQYEVALRLTPRGHPDRAVFHSNRAACLMQMRPVDHEAVAAECSLALQAQPRFPRALLRRARALEALRRYDLALQDVHALLTIDPSNRDALDLARRLRASLTPPSPIAADPPTSRPSPAALGASAVVAGIGPSLPARPVPKKPSAQTTISTRPLHNYQLNPPPSALTNGPLSKQSVPAKPTTSEDSSAPQLFAKILDNSKMQQDNKNPASSSSPSAGAATASVTRWRPLKLVYDHDIRLAQMPANCNFSVLREAVAKRFPSSKSVLIKYKDADGDLITITSTTELKLAESSADQIASKERKDGLETVAERDEKLSVLRLHIVEVSPEQEPPVHEEEDKVEEGGLIKGDESLSHSSAEMEENDDGKAVMVEKAIEQKGTSGKKKECDHAECKEVELDDWLLQFAELFRNQLGIDPDVHLDLNEVGMELCSAALEETVTSEEAQGLFETAAAKFQEVAALALFNWGNVHMCAARKRIPLDETASKEVMAAQLSAAYDWVRERYALAGQKYEEALRIKLDFYEGLLALGQQHFETAKLHWSFALANKVDLTTWNSSETINLFNSAEEKMKAATDIWEKAEEHRAAELKDPTMSKIDEVLKRRGKQGMVDGPGEFTADEAAEQSVVMRQQIHLFWGNLLFERSQVEYKLGFSNWKENLDASVERFKLAGASEEDISVVLKNHSSNGSTECEDKNVTGTSVDASKMSKTDEDKHVLES